MKFHIYHKIHHINMRNMEYTWSKLQEQKYKLRNDIDRKDYVKILKKYNMNNFLETVANTWFQNPIIMSSIHPLIIEETRWIGWFVKSG
jgi:hypothetical protein